MSDICGNCWDEIEDSDDYNAITIKNVTLNRSNGFRTTVLVEFKLCEDCADKLISDLERHNEDNHMTKEDIQ